MEKELAEKGKGVYLVNRGGANNNQAHLGLPGSSPEGGDFWRKQPSSPGRAGWQASPFFSYK